MNKHDNFILVENKEKSDYYFKLYLTTKITFLFVLLSLGFSIHLDAQPIVTSNNLPGFEIVGQPSHVINAINFTTINNFVAVSQPAEISASAVKNNDVSCYNGNNGKLTVTASGGTGTHTYSINGGGSYQASNIFSGLTAGTYSVIVKDANNYTKTTNSVTISQPSVLIHNHTKTNVSCNGSSDGSVTIIFSGGKAPYYVSFNGSAYVEQTSPYTIYNLPAGIYSKSVKDANGCIKSGTTTISQPSQILVSATKNNDVLCNGGSDGKLTVTASGGTGTLQYSINGGAYQTSNIFSGLAAGTYTVTVKDANNCSKTTNSVTINQPTAISWSCPTVSTSCFRGNDGSVTISFNGGTPPYLLSINNGPFVNQTSPVTFNNLAAGTYTKVLKDANGCTKTGTFTVSQPAAISASAVKDNDVSFFDGKDGKLTVTASGGTGTFLYSIDGSSSIQTSNVFAGLVAGNYSIIVKDVNNCTTTTNPVPISQPAPINDVSCTITEPLNNSVFRDPDSININALVSGQNIKVTDFYVNGNWIAADSIQPFSTGFINPSHGNHIITAIAKNNYGSIATSTSVNITVKCVPEDFNNSNLVDINDFSMFNSSFGKYCTCDEDLDRNGYVDIADFSIFINKFGCSCN